MVPPVHRCGTLCRDNATFCYYRFRANLTTLLPTVRTLPRHALHSRLAGVGRLHATRFPRATTPRFPYLPATTPPHLYLVTHITALRTKHAPKRFGPLPGCVSRTPFEHLPAVRTATWFVLVGRYKRAACCTPLLPTIACRVPSAVCDRTARGGIGGFTLLLTARFCPYLRLCLQRRNAQLYRTLPSPPAPTTYLYVLLFWPTCYRA